MPIAEGDTLVIRLDGERIPRRVQVIAADDYSATLEGPLLSRRSLPWSAFSVDPELTERAQPRTKVAAVEGLQPLGDILRRGGR